MNIFVFVLFIGTIPNLFAQKVLSKEISEEGNIILTEGIAIPKVNPGYTVWLPDTEIIEGLIVFTHSRRDTVNKDFIIEYALSKQLAIYGQSKTSEYKLKPKAIAICDSPLDMVRFNKEMIRAKQLNFNPITANEGMWVERL